MLGPLVAMMALLSPGQEHLKVVPAPPEFKAWKIVYLDGKDIWTCNGDGSGKKLTIKNADTPCWSPDKKQIAFSRGRQLWIANADGGSPKRLCTLKGDPETEVGWITWSPHKIVERFYPEENYGVDKLPGPALVVSLSSRDHSDLFQVLLSGKPGSAEKLGWLESGTGYRFSHYEYPEMSRSGGKLAMIVNGDIWVALAFQTPSTGDGGWDVTRLEAAASFDAPSYRASRENHPAQVLSWSPKADYLAYGVVRKGGSGTSDIDIIDLSRWDYWRDLTKVIRNVSVRGFSPCFSPDGRWVLCEYFGSGQGYDGLAAISTDGKRMVQLGVDGRFPRW